MNDRPQKVRLIKGEKATFPYEKMELALLLLETEFLTKLVTGIAFGTSKC